MAPEMKMHMPVAKNVTEYEPVWSQSQPTGREGERERRQGRSREREEKERKKREKRRVEERRGEERERGTSVKNGSMVFKGR